MTSPRSLDGDRKMVSDSLRVLEQVAARTGTVVYLEPLNRYQDHVNSSDDNITMAGGNSAIDNQ